MVLGAGAQVIFATSPASQSRTMGLGLGAEVSASRRFGLLKGLVLGYSFGLTRFLYGSTTAAQQTPLIPGCIDTTLGCDRFLNTGVRNVPWRTSHHLRAALLIGWGLGVDVGVGFFVDDLFEAQAQDTRISWMQGQDPTAARYFNLYSARLSYQPLDALGLALGVQTFNPQQRPDSTYYPFFSNRFTQLTLDLSLDVVGATAWLTEE